MSIARDLSSLPKAAPSDGEGWAPDPEPRFVHLLAEKWRADNDAAGPKERAFADARFRHSDAGKCARAIAYAALNLDASDPMDLTGVHNTSLGTLIHDAWQEVIAAKYPTARIEPKVRSVDGDGAGHIDAVFPDGKVVAFELKTIGGYGYKTAVGDRNAPQGPKFEHQVQAALNGNAVGADEVVIGYLSKEAISVNAAKKKHMSELTRFCAEWTLTREQYEPIAAREEKRVARILDLVDVGELPARMFPSPELPRGAVITDPKSGRWEVREGDKVVDLGSFWACGYCDHRTRCADTPAGRCTISEVSL